MSIASRSTEARKGGFIFAFVSYGTGAPRRSSVSVKWCGVTSHVTSVARDLP